MTDQTNERFVDDAGRYRLDSRIATGGMGEVWRATDTALGRAVAVKVLKTEYADDPAFRQRFATEARHAAALHHPGVAGVYDFGEAHTAGIADGSGVPRPFLVMELVAGEPLSTLLRQGLDARRDLDRDAVRDLLAQAGEALGAAHAAGIVHRDVKPANLMVTPSGQLKITDFGIARATDGVGITQTGAVMGTPQYLSPEQAQGNPATPRSDVYSLGVVAFECLAGRRPFDADSPVATALAHIREPVPDLPADVPADLAAVVRRALSKDPADRYADGAVFAAALRDPATEMLRTPPVVPVPGSDATQVLPATGATPVPPADGDGRAKKRRPWLPVLITLLAVALVVAIVLLVTTGDDDPESPPVDEPSATSDSPTEESRPTDPTTSPSEDQSFDIDEGDYVGRPVDEVVAELEGLGLDVTRDEIDNPGGEIEDRVAGVNPTGSMSRGDNVTVTYWGAAPPPEPTEPTEPTDPPTTETTPPADEPTDEPTDLPT